MLSRHKQLLTRTLFTVWLCSCAPAALADDLALGMQALEMGHTAQAIELWRPLAEAGNVEAQFGLGVIYNDAMGVPQDYAEANYWFLRAAEQGHAPSQFNLGNAYKDGTGMKVDPAMAVIWWRKAAEQNFTPAQFNLGSALMEGFGTPRDRDEALKWYRRAAANGHPQAKAYVDTLSKTPQEPPTATPPRVKPPEIARAPETETTKAIPRVTEPATPIMAASTLPAGCAEWLDRDSNTHTVQLMASQDERDVRAYIAQYALTDTAICHYPAKGKYWYALLYGRYDSARSAREALAALPAAVRAGGGYVRRISEIEMAVNSASSP